MDKRPTRSKMRATTPTEPEMAVAAVPKLGEANKRNEGVPAALTRVCDHPQNCPGASYTWRSSSISGLPYIQYPPISCIHFEPLSSAPTSRAMVPHPSPYTQARQTPPPQSPVLLIHRSSPPLTYLLSSSDLASGFRVVKFSAEKKRKGNLRGLFTHTVTD